MERQNSVEGVQQTSVGGCFTSTHILGWFSLHLIIDSRLITAISQPLVIYDNNRNIVRSPNSQAKVLNISEQSRRGNATLVFGKVPQIKIDVSTSDFVASMGLPSASIQDELANKITIWPHRALLLPALIPFHHPTSSKGKGKAKAASNSAMAAGSGLIKVRSSCFELSEFAKSRLQGPKTKTTLLSPTLLSEFPTKDILGLLEDLVPFSVEQLAELGIPSVSESTTSMSPEASFLRAITR